MHFKPMAPERLAQLLEGYRNELEPERKKLDAFYRQCVCPKCKSACRKETVPSHAFADPDSLVPRSCLRCLHCELLFDPHSDLILEPGKKLAPLPSGL